MIDRSLKNVIPEKAFRTLEDMDRKMSDMAKELAALRTTTAQNQALTTRQFSDVAGLIGARSQAVFGLDTTDPILPGQIGGGTVTSIAFSGGTTGFSATGSPITSSGTITLTLTITAGAIPFGNAGGNGLTTDSANFFWDNTNNYLGLGTNAPNVPLHVAANLADWGVRVINTSATGDGQVISGGDGGGATGRILQLRDKDGTSRVTFKAKGWVGIGTTSPGSPLAVVGLPVYANNAAAVLGGLAAGDLYRTNVDPDFIAVVH